MGSTYFDVLRLPRTATDAQISDAYRRLRALHANDPARLRAIETAYRVLANPITRRSYLRALEEGRAPSVQESEAAELPSDQAARGFVSLLRRAGLRRSTGTDKRSKTELLDATNVGREANGAGAAHPPPDNAARATPPSAGPRRRNRYPTELIDNEAARSTVNDEKAASSQTNSSGNSISGAADEFHTEPDRPEASHPPSAEDAHQTGRDETRISPLRRPKYLATIEVVYEGRTETFDLLAGTNWIGRPSKDEPSPAVPLPDPDRFVSRKHARIFLDDTTWTVTDTSENGTLLNGKPLRKGQPSRLKDGDVLTIEGRTLTIRRVPDG
ncbi:MAG: FHA domain-containing protein [Anaerolineae bacterium]|nr:FHA domain-containing protein [Thermoflexales bacterium]MDW8406607.1 FHA domain-containing protein [Anaerolineae bacterium]